MKQKYRKCECSCGYIYEAEVEYGPTSNISGEKTKWCPKCGKKPLCCSPQYEKEKKIGNLLASIHVCDDRGKNELI